MTAATEAEILAAFAESGRASAVDTTELVYQVTGAVRYVPDAANVECLWADLRPSEAARLADLSDEMYQRAEAVIRDALKQVLEIARDTARTFAAEHPDAPRNRQLTTAR